MDSQKMLLDFDYILILIYFIALIILAMPIKSSLNLFLFPFDIIFQIVDISGYFKKYTYFNF